MTIPAGWLQHPTSPEHMWNPATQEIRAVPVAMPPPAPPAAPPAPAATYETSMAAVQAEHAALAARSDGNFGDRTILDFDKLSKKGDKSELIVRFLPPWSAAAQGKAWAKTARYRLPADLCPWETKEKRFQYVDAFDQIGGPGNDPVAAAYLKLMESGNDDAIKFAKSHKAKPRIYWQAINLKDPRSHFKQATDAQGSPILDATGNPTWKVVPVVVPMGPQLHQSVLNFFIEKGDCTNPDSGYPMKLKKTKTGDADMDVAYDAMDMDKCPLDPAFRPVLGNLMDLREEMVWFHSFEEMNELAQNILAKFGLHAGTAQAPAPYSPPPASAPAAQPPGGPWFPHPSMPGHLYNAQHQVIPDPAAAPPPPPPPVAAYAPPPPPPAPPAPPLPLVAQAGYQAPPGPPLPPPVAPGLPQTPGYPPAGAVPPPPPAAYAPPMPPGMPPGVAAHPGLPPMPPAVGGGMTGDQLEGSLGMPNPFADDIPF